MTGLQQKVTTSTALLSLLRHTLISATVRGQKGKNDDVSVVQPITSRPLGEWILVGVGFKSMKTPNVKNFERGLNFPDSRTHQQRQTAAVQLNRFLIFCNIFC